MVTKSELAKATEALNALMALEVAAHQSRDFSQTLATWADDSWILPSYSGKFIKGAASVRRWIKANAQVPKYQRKLLRSEITPTLAFQAFSYAGTNTNSQGETRKFKGIMTRVLRREKGGDWKIIHAVWKDLAVSGSDGKLITDLEEASEGAVSMGCGSQVGAWSPGFVSAPSPKNPQKPGRRG